MAKSRLPGAERFFLRLGGELIINKDLTRFGDLCRLAKAMPTFNTGALPVLRTDGSHLG